MKISYYDLLGLLKENKHPTRVKLYLCNKSAIYYFDEDNNCYLIEDRSKESKIFCGYLRECLTDIECIE